MSRLPPRDGERIDRERELTLQLRRQGRDGARGRHDRLGAVRGRAAHLLAELQVPPPPRAHVLRRPVPQLPRAGGRRPRRARLHGAAARGHAGRAHERAARRSSSTRCAPPTSSAGPSPRPASTTRPSSARGGCGRSTRRCCATRPGSGGCRKDQDEREWRTEYRRRHADVLVVGGGAAGLSAAIAAAELGADVVLADEGAGARRRACSPRASTSARASSPTAAREAGVEVLSRGARARRLRRARAGLAGRHAPPGARPAHRLRHRVDRAAAAVPRQRPAGRDALGRRRAAGRALRVAPGQPRRGGHGRRPRARGGRSRCSTTAWSWPPWPTCASSGTTRRAQRS